MSPFKMMKHQADESQHGVNLLAWRQNQRMNGNKAREQSTLTELFGVEKRISYEKMQSEF